MWLSDGVRTHIPALMNPINQINSYQFFYPTVHHKKKNLFFKIDQDTEAKRTLPTPSSGWCCDNHTTPKRYSIQRASCCKIHNDHQEIQQNSQKVPFPHTPSSGRSCDNHISQEIHYTIGFNMTNT